MPAVIAIQTKKIISRFAQREAFSPDRAVTPGELGINENFIFRRLVSRGVITEAGLGRYYINRENLEDFNALRRRKVFIVLAVILVVVLVYALFYNK
jgi:hypothetical protein